MYHKKKFTAALAFLLLVLAFNASLASAKGGEYKKIVKHLKSNYKAKKVKIPFMFLARFAVCVVRPAGVKSFSVTLFEDLKFSRDTLDKEMQTAMRSSFGAEWSPIFRVRSRDGQQAYMYMREAGKSVKITLVTIEKGQAAVIRATFSPERLADFINNPKVFGISLDDNQKANNKIVEPKEIVVIEEPKKDI